MKVDFYPFILIETPSSILLTLIKMLKSTFNKMLKL